MSLVLELSPAEEQEVLQNAEREGVSVNEYVRRRVLPPDPLKPYTGGGKPFNVMQFAGVGKSSTADVEAQLAEIEASRNDWDSRDWRQPGVQQEEPS